MELEHRFTVPVPMAQAWDVLLDIERIAPCMPGATVDSFDGETIVGKVKVKVGPIQVTYAGTAKFVEKDESARRAVLQASAKEARGTGTAAATITAVLTDSGGSATDVIVTTDLAITGKPAQFGRGVMAEVGNKILGKFAVCLADELGAGGAGSGPVVAPAPGPASAPEVHAGAAAPPGEQTAAAASSVAASTTGSATRQATPAAATPIRRAGSSDDAIDLLDTAGLPVLKRLAPVLGGLLLVLLVWRLAARRRH
ncbi:MAG: SRPBCC family protein [Sporichthyaceae bacterium]